MDKEIEEIKGSVDATKEELNQTYRLVVDIMERSHKRDRFTIKCLMAIIFALLLINGYFAYMFVNTTIMETTEQEGIYNFVDSEGNMISSDLSLEEMKELIEINGKD